MQSMRSPGRRPPGNKAVWSGALRCHGRLFLASEPRSTWPSFLHIEPPLNLLFVHLPPCILTCALSPSRFIGVTDLAAVRFSLPSQLLEPTPNLEYWNYLDSPNAFIAIGTADEPVDRMLEVLRFWFTKDLKYAKGKPCKPYNSCLGEFFRVRLLVGRCHDPGWAHASLAVRYSGD